MVTHPRVQRRTAAAVFCALGVALLLPAFGPAPRARAATPTTAWQNGAFSENTAGVVDRSDVILGSPNSQAAQSLPLGNGSLGVAAWAAGGFTAQLNRADTLPGRKSPGQVVIPGLAKLTSAPNFTGRLDLYDGVLTESGGGMTMRAFVAQGSAQSSDELIVDVTGADPSTTQTADVHLWSGRAPSAAASGAIGTLAETWSDVPAPIGTAGTFGSMAAITAGGQDVAASVVSSTDVRVSFTPNADGSFRVIVAAPHWTGGNALTTAQTIFSADSLSTGGAPYSTTTTWWHNFWANAGLLELSSSDGAAQYLENIRTLYLFDNAAEEPTTGQLPGSTSGAASLFNFSADSQPFYPNAYWFWNLRQQVAANLSTGQYALNLPVYNLYLNNLANIQTWTKANMGGLPGICVPETMRFNGNGYQSDTSTTFAVSCQNATATYNGETITSGAEISLWIWQQYLDTGDLDFLKTYYPLISQSAQFLYSYASKGSDGLLHTVSNAHETQWDVTDPTTTLAAMRSLFPAEIQAAALLGTDQTLSAQLSTALTELPDYARTDESTHTQLLTASADASGTDVIGDSYQPTAAFHNSENIGLEPVWPYNVIGDDSGSLTALAQRTYTYRPNVNNPDWTDDAIDAARLDLPAQVQSTLVASVEKYQVFPSGMASWLGSQGSEPFIEEPGVVTTALDEALVTDYDGTLRIAPAWPSGWDASGTVYLRDQTKVDVQVEGGTTVTVGIVTGATHSMTIRNPWPGQLVQAVDGASGAIVLGPTSAGTFTLGATGGHSYLLEPTANPTTALPFAQVTGTPATAAKHLGSQSIGLDAPTAYASLAASFDNVGVTSDTNTNVGNFDGNGASMSSQALATAGAASGGTVTAGGLTFAWPAEGGGQNDNTLAAGQIINLGGSGSTLGFLFAATYGPLSGTGSIIYGDGTVQSFTLSATDWQATPTSGETTAVTEAYQNRAGNTQYNKPSYVLYAGIPLAAGKTVTRVQLPNVGPVPAAKTAELHIFAIAIG
ncbi:MAG TPA: hypothetical protein VFA06_09045 [Actinocrinis sp.]|uniref:glycosyl hydrolase family 95 catalytic domain-containing protein n=1 Tax=Actinocrinis sp. TaxID=1920516 RepID=UPI002D756569|nr:hypothetical protein [Actinocrinis sp.]HZU55997.1 hypothetical protein [Actinocrinis sp.]